MPKQNLAESDRIFYQRAQSEICAAMRSHILTNIHDDLARIRFSTSSADIEKLVGDLAPGQANLIQKHVETTLAIKRLQNQAARMNDTLLANLLDNARSGSSTLYDLLNHARHHKGPTISEIQKQLVAGGVGRSRASAVGKAIEDLRSYRNSHEDAFKARDIRWEFRFRNGQGRQKTTTTETLPPPKTEREKKIYKKDAQLEKTARKTIKSKVYG